MPTRAEEFQEVRRLLGQPIQGSPSPDLIISQLLRQEQLMLNKLNGSGKGWSVGTVSVASVAGQNDYAIKPVDMAKNPRYGFGKALFVYRDLGNGDIMPVPMTDFSHELHNQSHSFWLTPAGSDSPERFRSEKVAFWRSAETEGTATQMMRIYPTPEAEVIYKVSYAAGAVDSNNIALSDVPVMPEWSNIRTIETAMYLLPDARWEGFSPVDNANHRKERATSLMAQVADHREEFAGYLANPHHEPLTDSGYWWEI